MNLDNEFEHFSSGDRTDGNVYYLSVLVLRMRWVSGYIIAINFNELFLTTTAFRRFRFDRRF